MVDFPTRGENTLDLFLTNRPSLINRCQGLPGISDHDVVFVDSNIRARLQKPPKRNIRLWDKADFDEIRQRVRQFTSDLIAKHSPDTPVEELWSKIRSEINSLMEELVPTKMSSTRWNQPWINRKVKQLRRGKKRCHKRARQTKSNQWWSKYRELQKLVQAECRRAYSEYMRHIICGEYEGEAKNKRFWSYVKSLRRDSCGVAPLKKDGVTHIDNQAKAEILNSQFASVFTKEDTGDLPQMGESPYPDIPDIQIHVPGVAKLLRELNPHKASGPDEVPARFLKECADELAPALGLLFEASLKQCTVPHDWQEATVTPLFKKGKRAKASNYRPVSLTSICC